MLNVTDDSINFALPLFTFYINRRIKVAIIIWHFDASNGKSNAYLAKNLEQLKSW